MSLVSSCEARLRISGRTEKALMALAETLLRELDKYNLVHSYEAELLTIKEGS